MIRDLNIGQSSIGVVARLRAGRELRFGAFSASVNETS